MTASTSVELHDFRGLYILRLDLGVLEFGSPYSRYI